MRFARRTPPAPADTDQAPERPQPPRGAPVAAFAGILDGRRLWLAIEARPGSLALRDAVGGDVIALASDAQDDQPAYNSLRIDLTELPGDDEATYDVVLVPGSGRQPKPVWTPPLEGRQPPIVPGSTTRFSLRRTDDGHLRVHRGRVEAAAELRRIEVAPEGVRLTIDGPATTVALLDDDDVPVATFATQSGEQAIATITTDRIPADATGMTRVVVGEPGAWLPIRRHRNDVAEPGRAAPLPQLYGGDGDDPRLRLRWGPRAFLMARLLDRDAG